ncbi:purple acid phosphatase [Striga asiatica]|uniref:Purple acid phosphatase n=1 Tax=Striga asiatica TaxID=4170 RepID=A0A5A7R2H0_STRAF|nr:purple acid phosphatase [Striga asiatica]
MMVRLLLLSCVLLSLICIGSAGVTSAFIRTEWPSVDIPLDNEAFAVPKGYNAPQQVHITQGDYDGKAVIISWVTTDEPGSNKIRYGLSEGHYDFTAEGTVHNYTFYNYKSGYLHQALVDGLQYDTKYYYEIGDGDSSRKFWFQTPPQINPDASYKFGIIGDLGQTFNSLSTLDHCMKTGAQAILFVGDLSYADRYDNHDIGVRWDTWGRFVEKSAAYQPWIWSAGNHEIEYFPHLGEVTPFRNYLQRYPTPYPASKSSNPLWYAIRRGSAHVIVLSSYSPFDKSAPIYITVGDGGNQEGLANRFRVPQPEYSAFREASYGHSTLEIMNRTHAFYHWNRNDDGKLTPADSFVLHNQYWGNNHRRRKLKKNHLHSVLSNLRFGAERQHLTYELVVDVPGL